MDNFETWTATLRLLQETFPEAVIAGGCLRDLDHGVEVKDVDIFIRDRALAEHEMLREIEKKIGIVGSSLIKPESVEYVFGMDSDVSRVFDFGIYQIIALKELHTLLDVVRRIDFGLCRIGFDGEHHCISPDYVVDKHGKQFTLLRCESSGQYSRSMARFDRLKDKYPEHRLVIPERFTAFEPFNFDVIDGENVLG